MSKVELAGVLTRARAAIGNSPAEARRIILEAGELDCNNEDFIAIQQIHARSFYKDEDLRAPNGDGPQGPGYPVGSVSKRRQRAQSGVEACPSR